MKTLRILGSAALMAFVSFGVAHAAEPSDGQVHIEPPQVSHIIRVDQFGRPLPGYGTTTITTSSTGASSNIYVHTEGNSSVHTEVHSSTGSVTAGSPTYPPRPAIGVTAAVRPQFASTTGWHPGVNLSSTSPVMGMHGVPGVVSGITDSSFRLTVPNPASTHATTSFTVSVSNTTKFRMGSTTATFADVTAGAHVEVIGKVSTSTKTIAASYVLIGDGRLQQAIQEHPGFFQKLKSIFVANHSSTTQSGGPAAVESSGGFMSRAFHAMFGWL